MRILQADRLLVPDEPDQQICRIDPGRQEFDVGAAVRDPGHDEVGIQDLGGELGSLPPLGRGEKLGRQIVLDHQRDQPSVLDVDDIGFHPQGFGV
jgi:hypothetical protein